MVWLRLHDVGRIEAVTVGELRMTELRQSHTPIRVSLATTMRTFQWLVGVPSRVTMGPDSVNMAFPIGLMVMNPASSVRLNHFPDTECWRSFSLCWNYSLPWSSYSSLKW